MLFYLFNIQCHLIIVIFSSPFPVNWGRILSRSFKYIPVFMSVAPERRATWALIERHVENNNKYNIFS